MKLIISILSILTAYLATTTQVQAVCPVCTVAVGAGLGISRLIGIDDSVTGLWIGGLILSSGLWLADFLKKRKLKLPFPELISILLMIIFVIPPLYWSKIIGLQGNSLWGVDKIILGTIAGSLVFLSGVGIDRYLRKINNGKVFIYFQKVIIPVLLISIVSFIFYLITS